MRRIGRLLAPLPAAMAMIAAVACLAGSLPPQAHAQTDEVALPHPLAADEAARLRGIFMLQAHGDLPGARRLAATLRDGSDLGQAMLGEVLADRYLGPDDRPGAVALGDWLDRWPELPDAAAIYRLLLARLPPGEVPPPPPPSTAGALQAAPKPAAETATESDPPRHNPVLDQDVRAVARARGAVGVARLLARTPGLSADYAADLRGEAARILFTLNRDDDAFAVAAAALQACAGHDICARAGLAGFIAGLAAWRQDRIPLAGAMFAAGWRADTATPDMRAANAFWAARVAERQDNPAAFRLWLLHAAEQPRSFYGLLARRRLGLRAGLARLDPGERQTPDEADGAMLAATTPGLHALALLQIGQTERAEAELRLLWPAAQHSRALARAVTLVAAQVGLADTEASFADLLADADGRPRDPTPPPKMPDLRPAGGFRVDPAMVYGIARTESNFDAAMVSSAGARGLLQIMPETARDMLGRPLAGEAALLHDPAFNLDLGQRYIAFLAEQDPVRGSLIGLLASYNAGLGNFARWASQIRDNGDPLLFIEAIPVEETRDYVPRVLRYTWMYAARLHLPAPSLDELAAGLWPRYHPHATPAQTVARAE